MTDDRQGLCCFSSAWEREHWPDGALTVIVLYGVGASVSTCYCFPEMLPKKSEIESLMDMAAVKPLQDLKNQPDHFTFNYCSVDRMQSGPAPWFREGSKYPFSFPPFSLKMFWEWQQIGNFTYRLRSSIFNSLLRDVGIESHQTRATDAVETLLGRLGAEATLLILKDHTSNSAW